MSEIKEVLKSEYPYRIEMHAHSSPVSGCSQVRVKELAERYAKEEVDGICLMNHFYKGNLISDGITKQDAIDIYLKDYYDLIEAAKPYGLNVYLGCEIRFAENINDYLIYGVDRSILEEGYDYLTKTLIDYRNNVTLPNSVFLQAHPFRNNMVQVDPKLLDGIETLNCHPHHNSRIAIAARYADEQHFPVTVGGSDFHELYHAALLLLRTKVLPKDSFEIASILRSGDYLFEIGKNHIVLP